MTDPDTMDAISYFDEMERALTERRLKENIEKALDQGLSEKEILDIVYEIVVENIMAE